MPRALKRLAALKSYVDEDGSGFQVNVFDEGNSNIIMWLHASIARINSIRTLNISIVDFDDEQFFKLPQKRQDACATVLFKKFLSYYREKYGKNTEEWLPVSANFANYKLQEKFKQAVDAGIFPPQSLDITNFTTEDTWENDLNYNMSNRKLQQQFKENPQEFFPSANIQGNGYVANITVSDFINIKLQFVQEYPTLKKMIVENIVGFIEESGDVYFKLFSHLSSVGFLRNKPGRFKYYEGENTVSFETILTQPELEEFITPIINQFKSTFDIAQNYRLFADEPRPIAEITGEQEEIQANINRLIKKRG